MSIDKNNSNTWNLDSKKLLDKLAINIANKFWMEKQKAIELLKTDTSNWLNILKKDIENQEDIELKELFKKLWDKKLEQLFFMLKWAQEIIEKSSKIEIKILKADIEKNSNIENFKNNIEDYLPPKLISIAKNPQKIHEHILGFALGTTNSIFKTVEIIYEIWKGIIKTPIDLYLILSWKAITDSFDDI